MRTPDYQSSNFNIQAWKMKHTNEPLALKLNPVNYLIQGPFHPLWNQWILSLVCLADFEGAEPAKKESPDMTHEIIVAAVNPDFKVNPNEIPKDLKLLIPRDVVKQFKVPVDLDAEDLASKIIKYIIDGHLSPDQDYRSVWNQIIEKSAEHYWGLHETKH